MTEYKQVDFFRLLYDPVIAAGKLTGGQKLRLLIFDSKNKKGNPHFFDSIDDLIDKANKAKNYADVYFQLATTDGKSGQTDSLITRTCLAFDFDGKNSGLTVSDIITRFRQLKLWHHALIDSGNGYHAYVLINPTSDFEKVDLIQSKLAERLGADPNAIKKTQILRVPYTQNRKGDPKPVKIVNLFTENVKRYDIDHLYARFGRSERSKKQSFDMLQSTTSLPPCIDQALSQGTAEGQRNATLSAIVPFLRHRGKTLQEIKAVCKEWAEKSDYDDNLEYRVEYLYNNQRYAKIDCKGCPHNCFAMIESDFDFIANGGIVLQMPEKHICKIKGKSAEMKANDFLIYGVLKTHSTGESDTGEGLTRAEIDRELTHNGKRRLGDKTIRESLKNLQNMDMIEIKQSGKTPVYSSKPLNWVNIDFTFDMSAAVIYAAVKGEISAEELRLYAYMRYVHNQQQREDKTALKGNLFQYKQADLARDLGITQGRVSQMINNLLSVKILGEWYRKPSKYNSFDYIVYRLIY